MAKWLSKNEVRKNIVFVMKTLVKGRRTSCKKGYKKELPLTHTQTLTENPMSKGATKKRIMGRRYQRQILVRMTVRDLLKKRGSLKMLKEN